MNVLWVFGATSAIAQATTQKFVENGYNLVLIGRNKEKLSQLQQHYQTLGADYVGTYVTELNMITEPDDLINKISDATQAPDIVLLAQGALPDQKNCEQSFSTALQTLDINMVSPIALLGSIANLFEKKQSGAIIAISSVAGDRGRQSNYYYGVAKGGLSTYLSGLRNRLAPLNIQVLTVKPGFVDTPMTDEFDKNGPLWAKPEKIAADIYAGFLKKKSTIYTPGFWRLIMLVIKLIPEIIFKRLKL